MIYLEENDKIVCYKVNIDKEKLEKVRRKIIYNCSLITNKITEENSNYLISNENYNVYSCEYLRSIDRDYYIEDVYKITYERIIHPPIIKKIDSILNGDYSSLSTIFENFSIKDIKIEEFKNKKQEIIDRINKLEFNSNESSLVNLNNELENLKKMYNFKNLATIEEVSNYYDEIRECINIEKIKEIPKVVYEDVIDFFKEQFPKDLEPFSKINKDIKTLKLKP